jgi:hypothetical protein
MKKTVMEVTFAAKKQKDSRKISPGVIEISSFEVERYPTKLRRRVKTIEATVYWKAFFNVGLLDKIFNGSIDSSKYT